jgi:nucleotide-binding universal stress UspA family protein
METRSNVNKPIVCGTDFSPRAEGALAWAAAMARREGCDISLVYAIRNVSVGSPLLGFESEQIQLDATRLREAARAATQELGVSIRPQILRGEPHEAILRHAREEDARLIVLGTGGLSLAELLTLGSVAERTARSADRTVVLVPRRPAVDVWATSASGAARPPRVLAGLGDGDDAAIVRFTASLRRAAPCDVTFLRLYWPMAEYARLGLQGARDLSKTDPDIVKNLEPALRAKTAGLPGQGAVALDIRPAWGEPSSNLLAAVEDCEADLLVVGAHERHGVGRFLTGSVAERLARQSRYVPVAVIPTETTTAGPAAIPILRTVLAVTDFSPLGNAALVQAYALVRATGGVVELCHVYEHALPSPSYAYDAPGPGISELERARLVKELRDLIPAEAKGLGIATHVSIVDGGKAAEAIVQAAERLDVDVITMASHGRGGLARTLLGSVAQEVVHRAHRPVYVVRSRR